MASAAKLYKVHAAELGVGLRQLMLRCRATSRQSRLKGVGIGR
jgi:hypothetical protein